MKRISKFQAIAIISIAIAGSAVAAPIITTLTATADTRIGGSLTQTTLNHGGADQMLVGNHTSLGNLHGLLRFDLSALPTEDFVINSVTLNMVKPANGTGTAFTVNVYQLSAANADWVEGTANNVAQAGSATWLSKGSSAWAGSDGASTAGTDYINTVLASYGGVLTAGDAAFTSQAAFTTVVGTSFGGVLNLGLGMNSGASGQYYRFSTKEEVDYAGAELVITYTIIPEPSSLVLMLGAGFLLVLELRRRRG